MQKEPSPTSPSKREFLADLSRPRSLSAPETLGRPPKEKADQLITWVPRATVDFGQPLTGDHLNASAQENPIFTYVCNGEAWTVGKKDIPAGVYDVEVHSAETTSYKASANPTIKRITVERADQVITWKPKPTVGYGEPLTGEHLNASAHENPKFLYLCGGEQWTPGKKDIPAGTYDVEVSSEETANYKASAKPTMGRITVERADQVLTWKPKPTVVYGEPLTGEHLNASALENPKFTYVCNGEAWTSGKKDIPAGSYDVEVGSEETANYKASAKPTMGRITVERADQVITSGPRPDLVYGNPLTEAHLNAAGNENPKFVYYAGKVIVTEGTKPPSAGTFQLFVTCEETTNYLPVVKSHPIGSITVLKADFVAKWPPTPIQKYHSGLTIRQLLPKLPGFYQIAPPETFDTIFPVGNHIFTLMCAGPNANYNTQTTQMDVELYDQPTIQEWMEHILGFTPPGNCYVWPCADLKLGAKDYPCHLTIFTKWQVRQPNVLLMSPVEIFDCLFPILDGFDGVHCSMEVDILKKGNNFGYFPNDETDLKVAQGWRLMGNDRKNIESGLRKRYIEARKQILALILAHLKRYR